jgi:hypothetical protein
MTERYHAFLANASQAHACLTALFATLKPFLIAGHRFELEIKPEGRNGEQNKRFHAMCGDFAKSGVLWQGKPRTGEQWKVLLVSGHSVATKEGSEIVPGLEGEFVNIRESTALMSKKRSSSLIDYTRAYGDLMGVRWTEPAEQEA